ncbi:MAG: helix-turn-helix domain-containing protein [Nitriliruptor sp.]
MSQDEREEIALGLAVQRSFADIARQLDRPTSTVAREVDRNGPPPRAGPADLLVGDTGSSAHGEPDTMRVRVDEARVLGT